MAWALEVNELPCANYDIFFLRVWKKKSKEGYILTFTNDVKFQFRCPQVVLSAHGRAYTSSVAASVIP